MAGAEHGEHAAWMRGAVAWAARVVFPEVCAGCGVTGTWMCAECAARCVVINPQTSCQRCGNPDARATMCRRCQGWPSALSMARGVYLFDGPIRDAVYRLKYGDEHARAAWGGDALARLFDGLGWQPTLLVPTPLHPRRRRQRGYNQSEKLAQALSARVGIPTANALERLRDTRPQVGLTADDRLRNVAGAFATRLRLDGHGVLLIDDVLTTGSTLLDCARACRAGGALDVRALTVAMGN